MPSPQDTSVVDGRPPLPSLTALRAWAALLVLGYHLGLGPFSWKPLQALTFGYVGVSFFFVLSGFVLTWATRPGFSVRRFYVRRLARVYPAHVVALGVVTVVALLTPSERWTVADPVQGAKQALLVNAWTVDERAANLWNGVSWSLSVEAFCYLCFPLLIWGLPRLRGSRQALVVGCALVLGLAVTVLLRERAPEQGVGISYLNPAVRLPEFVLGIGLALRVRATPGRTPLPLWVPLALCGVLAVLARRIALPLYPLADHVVLPGLALLILTAARRDLAGTTGRVLGHRVATYLGELSFCFYLVHVLVVGLVLRATGWGRPWALGTGVVPVAVILVLAGLAAAALHHGVERPAQAAIARRTARPVGPPEREPALSR